MSRKLSISLLIVSGLFFASAQTSQMGHGYESEESKAKRDAEWKRQMKPPLKWNEMTPKQKDQQRELNEYLDVEFNPNRKHEAVKRRQDCYYSSHPEEKAAAEREKAERQASLRLMKKYQSTANYSPTASDRGFKALAKAEQSIMKGHGGIREYAAATQRIMERHTRY